MAGLWIVSVLWITGTAQGMTWKPTEVPPSSYTQCMADLEAYRAAHPDVLVSACVKMDGA